MSTDFRKPAKLQETSFSTSKTNELSLKNSLFEFLK